MCVEVIVCYIIVVFFETQCKYTQTSTMADADAAVYGQLANIPTC